MKIAFSAQLLLDHNKTGIGWLSHHLVEEMHRAYQENKCEMHFFGKRKCLRYRDIIEDYGQKGFQIRICKWFSFALCKMLWSFLPIPYHFFIKEKADMMLFFNYYIPPGVRGRKVVMIHDMTYMAYPETMNKKTLYMLRLNVKNAAKRADKIITISEFSKKEIIKYLKVDPNKIEVMPVGVDTSVFRVFEDEDIIRETARKYGVNGQYFLYLGTLEPRKNIVRMLDAYAMLKKEYPDAPKFVFAGRKGWMYDEIFERVKAYGLEEDVIFTGYIAQEDAPLLMNGAKAFLFVSLYEGFGMPVLEAMACGTPVITANTASMPEVVGDCGLLADPMSAESIKECMEKIINQEVDAEDMIRRGLERCKEFTWEKAADKVMEVCKSIV